MIYYFVLVEFIISKITYAFMDITVYFMKLYRKYKLVIFFKLKRNKALTKRKIKIFCYFILIIRIFTDTLIIITEFLRKLHAKYLLLLTMEMKKELDKESH